MASQIPWKNDFMISIGSMSNDRENPSDSVFSVASPVIGECILSDVLLDILSICFSCIIMGIVSFGIIFSIIGLD